MTTIPTTNSDLNKHVLSIAERLGDLDILADWCDWEDGEPNAGEYLQDVLDIEYIVSSDREYLGARILVAFGGPNIWINTRTNTVEGHWWSESATCRYEDALGLDDYLSEIWDCGA